MELTFARQLGEILAPCSTLCCSALRIDCLDWPCNTYQPSMAAYMNVSVHCNPLCIQHCMGAWTLHICLLCACLLDLLPGNWIMCCTLIIFFIP